MHMTRGKKPNETQNGQIRKGLRFAVWNQHGPQTYGYAKHPKGHIYIYGGCNTHICQWVFRN